MSSVVVIGLAALTLGSIAFFVWRWIDLLTIANRIRYKPKAQSNPKLKGP
jgi:hypothetical protein